MQILGKELIKTIALANNSGIWRVFFKIVDNILISFHKVYVTTDESDKGTGRCIKWPEKTADDD